MESEIEARQQQNPESLRGVHEQVIKLIDNMVQNYLGNVRRTIQRMTNFIDNRRSNSINSKPRESPNSELVDDSFSSTRQSILDGIQLLSKRMHEFTIQWSKIVGKQQSPLIDRIPPRGMELWRDFWDTVRKQVRRINKEFRQISEDMGRMLTGRLPGSNSFVGTLPNPRESLFYFDNADKNDVVEQFKNFHDKMSVVLGEQQQKMDSLMKVAQAQSNAVDQSSNNFELNNNNLIDEQDDELTRNELTRNVALRQQIQQDINVFSSIFDIMRAFIQRLRESATNAVRDVMQPGASNNNDNNPVTPGPSVKPQVDQVLAETINSQRVINGQAKPVLLPNVRPALNPRF